MNLSTVEIIDRGLKCLSDNLGAGETEIFITTILKERFDYTKWRHSLVDSIETFDELDAFVEKSKEKAQFQGKANEIL